jgi:hypothetical protein
MIARALVLRPLFVVAILTVIIAAVAPSSATELAGIQGTDTSLPATPSAMTLSGRGQFSGLQITVNQTSDLVNQAVSVTWSGGQPTISDSKPFSANYLQIMQCWGDDDGTVPSNPGPPPDQCVFGASNAVFGAADANILQWGFASLRALSNKNWPDFDPSQGAVDPASGVVWEPFHGVTGDVTNVPLNQNFDPNVAGGAYWLNPDFDAVTTNEIAGARTGPDGKGAELFQVNTGVESSGLGCGQQVQPVAGGNPVIPKCWLVIVPRGTGAQEDVGAPTNVGAAGPNDVVTSPLSPNVWKNRIAFPLQFNPVQSPCALAANQVQVSGNELAETAISSWQPALCSTAGHDPYAYSVVSDAAARLQLQSDVVGGPGMIVVNQPFDPSAFASSNPVVYAPLTLSATVVGFNVERNPNPTADAASQALSGVRIADINLTPRLLAKLLTQSYTSQISIQGPPPKSYTWATGNPVQMGTDPDFLQFNPEFTTLTVNQGKDFGGLVLPLGNSDQAAQVWQYVLADPEAKAWLDGQPDPWGMRVNPVYATTASANSAGAAFADPVPNSFPKSDPYCYQAQTIGANVVPPPICGNGWLPYATSLHLAAKETRMAADGAKIVENVFAQSPDQVWGVDVPQRLGVRAIMSLTDSPSAALFGIQTARLSRAGDDGSTRQFVAADSAGMTAAVASMKANTVPGVLEPDPSAVAPNAYPLTELTYAVSAPLQLDTASRQNYAYLLDYASGAGQTPGLQQGQLPNGYAPLPAALLRQTAAAAGLITSLTAPAAPSGPAPSVPLGGSNAAQPVTSASTGSPASPVGASSAPAPSGPLPVATTTPTRTNPAVLLTPALSADTLRFFVPGLIVVCLLSALGALEITKRPRFGARRTPGRDDNDGDLTPLESSPEGAPQ